MKRSLLPILFILTVTSFAQVPRVSAGRIEQLKNFPSKYVEARNIDVWLPPGYTKEKKYAVLYMHDGQNLFDTTYTYNRKEWKVDEEMALLQGKGQIKETIVVGIYNSADRWLEFFPNKPFKTLQPAWQDSLLTGMHMKGARIKSDDYLKFIVKELKPYIDSAYSTYPDAANTFTMGSSIAGLISVYAVCEYPTVFGGAAALSTHWPGGQLTGKKDNQLMGQAMNNYLKAKLPSPSNHRFFFDYGTESLDKLYEPYQQTIDQTMSKKGYTNKSWMTVKVWGGDNSEESWSRRLGAPMFFLLQKNAPVVIVPKMKPIINKNK
jgi:predicted alpha/beta superfamily hydrolase